MKKGNIGITTENIFPVIKKFLYSDHEIFLREVVSNAVDATQKIKTLSSNSEFKGSLGDLKIKISIDKEKGTLTISDQGIGMTTDEVEKYINQIAFSGATDFLEKYKDNTNAIIGHFGLGFYSTFMVSQKVEIQSLSYRKGSKGVKWVCDGTPNYEMEEINKENRGTDIILYIADDCKEFLEANKIEEMLKKYCKFLPIPIVFGKKTEWKDGKNIETDQDNIINNTTPLWISQPSNLKDEDYKKFYNELYPYSEEPLFWIHLNVDFPFHLTGILYFPKIKNNIEIQRNKIQLYCNQVFVTEQVDNIVPEYLTLLYGVIDSPDIPLNVSRSYLQSDQNVKKISSYITKKVADRLLQIFKNDRQEFEKKWDSLKIFIHYGMLSDSEFYDRAKNFLLLKDVDQKYYTLEEYKKIIETAQTDKDNNIIYLYTNNINNQYTYIEAAKEKGYNVLFLDGELDLHLIQMLEQKLEKSRFTRVDSNTIDKLIQTTESSSNDLNDNDKSILIDIFKSQIPKIEKSEFNIEINSSSQNNFPIIITQNEYMRRMKDVSHLQPGMSFYGEMPNNYTIVLNSNHPLIKNILDESQSKLEKSITPINNEIKGLEARVSVINNSLNETDIDEKRQEELRLDLKETNNKIETEKKKKSEIIQQYSNQNNKISQIIDLGLLQYGLLKGESLSKFLKRSIELIN